MKLFASILLSLALLVPASAQTSSSDFGSLDIGGVRGHLVTEDLGGNILEYLQKYNRLRDHAGTLEITDVCLSACTMFFGLIPLERVCAEPFALLGFHSAWREGKGGKPEFAKEGTRLLWNMYPNFLQSILKNKGWDGDGDVEHPDMIYIRGQDVLQHCKDR